MNEKKSNRARLKVLNAQKDGWKNIKFVQKCMDLQRRQGRHAHWEYPLRDFLKLCKNSKFKKWASKYQVVPWEQCAFNLKDPNSKKKCRKASVLITTDEYLAKIFSERRCACPRGSHEVLYRATRR